MSGAYEVLDAIRKGDLERLKKALQANPAVAAGRDEQGVSLLLQALYHRQPEMVEAMLAHRDTLDLFEAAALGHVEALAAALDVDPGDAGPAVAAFSPDGFTALHLACFFGNEKTAALLLERGAEVAVMARNPLGVLPLSSAVAGGHVGIVRRLLAAGADVESRQAGGFTPLLGAAAGGKREMVELVLAYGADRGARSDDGRTATDLARERGHEELAALLES